MRCKKLASMLKVMSTNTVNRSLNRKRSRCTKLRTRKEKS